jgi:hypothetical protein
LEKSLEKIRLYEIFFLSLYIDKKPGNMNHTGDPIERLDEHKYLRRFQELSKRIDVWKQVGPACSEDEWNSMEAALENVNELVRLCTANGTAYKVPAYRLILANHYWKLYSKENKVLKWNFTKHQICQE